MKLKALLIACWVLAAALSLGAQSGDRSGDVVTGTWTGYMQRTGGERMYITVALKLDGRNVTGTITGPPRPGEIRTGTFDRATGELKFEVAVQDDAKTFALFEGKVVQTSATGQVTVNDQKGVFNITRDGAGAKPAPASASGDATIEALRRSFTEVSDNVTKAADLVPADKYNYRPTPAVRTYGQMVAHIADGYNYYCATASGREVQWTDAIEKGSTDKTAIVQKLKEATDACKAAYTSGQIGPLVGNVGHSNLHYGNLVTYIRMLGLVPPSS